VRVADALLDDLGASPEVLRVKSLAALEVRERQHELPPSCARDVPQVALLHAANPHHAGFDHKLGAEVVDALGGHDDVCAARDDLLNPLLRDLDLAVLNLLELGRVFDEDADAHLEAVALKVEAEEGDLRVRHLLRHALRAARAVEGEAVDELGLDRRAPVALQDRDRRHRVLDLARRRLHLDGKNGVHDHVGEEVGFRAEDLGREARLRAVHQHFAPKRLGVEDQPRLNLANRRTHCEAVARHHNGRVHLLPHELVRSSEELGSDDDDRGRAVAHLAVLQVRELHHHLRRRVLHVELLQNRCAIVRDRHVAELVNEHLVEANRAERRLDDVRQRQARRNCAREREEGGRR
jgi:hypothetical protein